MTDIGIGRLLASGGLLLQGGLEKKAAVPDMIDLPAPRVAIDMSAILTGRLFYHLIPSSLQIWPIASAIVLAVCFC